MEEFKDIIYNLRKEHDLTRDALAVKLGVSKSTVAMWETGKRNPSRETMELIADTFNVDMDYLRGKQSDKRLYTFEPKNDRLDDAMRNIQAYLMRMYSLRLSHEDFETIEAFKRATPEVQQAIRTLLGL